MAELAEFEHFGEIVAEFGVKLAESGRLSLDNLAAPNFDLFCTGSESAILRKMIWQHWYIQLLHAVRLGILSINEYRIFSPPKA